MSEHPAIVRLRLLGLGIRGPFCRHCGYPKRIHAWHDHIVCWLTTCLERFAEDHGRG